MKCKRSTTSLKIGRTGRGPRGSEIFASHLRQHSGQFNGRAPLTDHWFWDFERVGSDRWITREVGQALNRARGLPQDRPVYAAG